MKNCINLMDLRRLTINYNLHWSTSKNELDGELNSSSYIQNWEPEMSFVLNLIKILWHIQRNGKSLVDTIQCFLFTISDYCEHISSKSWGLKYILHLAVLRCIITFPLITDTKILQIVLRRLIGLYWDRFKHSPAFL